MNTTNFWQRKLLALLHDPPHKALDIPGHTERRETFVRQAGFVNADAMAWYEKNADRFAAAADRFPFPSYRESKLASPFGGPKHPFRHPMGQSSLSIADPPSPEVLEAVLSGVQHYAQFLPVDAVGEERDRLNFFLHWRRWAVDAAHTDARTSCLPADTRIPDHTIWNHNSIVSAFQGCWNPDTNNIEPAFLLFQAGPVQEFIAQARSTRDLWSGSYLLSWLMAHAIKAVTDVVGPDAVIFPFLRAQPIFDLLHRDSIYTRVPYTGPDGRSDTLWGRMKQHEREMLVPNLPNRFLALVPAGAASRLAAAAERAFRAEFVRLAGCCWDWFGTTGLPMKDAWRSRFDAQIAGFPQVAWQTNAWTATGNESWREANEETDRQLASRRNTRDFSPWPVGLDLTGTRKDSLSGKEEVVGDEAWWICARQRDTMKHLFRSADVLGAVNLVKRVWHKAYLEGVWGLDVRKAVDFESVPDVAAAKWRSSQIVSPPPSYVAVIALDGDEMGKWMSGAKMPLLAQQLSCEASAYLKDTTGGGRTRPLFPSFHEQFSEALANFGVYLARMVVESFNGQLIYSGGDDVLCMVPAAAALDCAEALRAAFRGQPRLTELVAGRFEVAGNQGGWVRLAAPKAEQPTWPLLVPGPAADVSAGIAIGHSSAPLQMLVREAQGAERRAKDDLGRSALAISLFKRSGEIIEWGAKWDSGALALYREFVVLSTQGEPPALSGKFAYALETLLAPYRSPSKAIGDMDSFPVWEVLTRELDRVLDRQATGNRENRLATACRFRGAWNPYRCYLESNKRDPLADLPGLLRVANFIWRGERS